MKKLLIGLLTLSSFTAIANTDLASLMGKKLKDKTCLDKEFSRISSSQRHLDILENGHLVENVKFSPSIYTKYNNGREANEVAFVVIYTDGSTQTGFCEHK